MNWVKEDWLPSMDSDSFRWQRKVCLCRTWDGYSYAVCGLVMAFLWKCSLPMPSLYTGRWVLIQLPTVSWPLPPDSMNYESHLCFVRLALSLWDQYVGNQPNWSHLHPPPSSRFQMEELWRFYEGSASPHDIVLQTESYFNFSSQALIAKITIDNRW